MGVTGNTIPVDAAPVSSGRDGLRSEALPTRVGSILWALFILAASGFLGYLAWPRLHASLLYLPVDTAIAKYHAGEWIEDAQIDALAGRAREAIGRQAHHRYWDGLSLLMFLKGANTENRLHVRRDAFEASVEAAEVSLALAPAQPRTWLRLARSRSWLRYPPEQVIEALKMSAYTGRVEPSLFATRLELGLAYLPRMDGEGRSLMRDQVLLAWGMQPRELARGIKSGRLPLSAVEELLAGPHEPVLDDIRRAADGPAR